MFPLYQDAGHSSRHFKEVFNANIITQNKTVLTEKTVSDMHYVLRCIQEYFTQRRLPALWWEETEQSLGEILCLTEELLRCKTINAMFRCQPWIVFPCYPCVYLNSYFITQFLPIFYCRLRCRPYPRCVHLCPDSVTYFVIAVLAFSTILFTGLV